MSRYVRVYCYRKTEVFIGFVKVIKVVFPEILNNAGVNPAVRVGHILNEHLDELSMLTKPLDA